MKKLYAILLLLAVLITPQMSAAQSLDKMNAAPINFTELVTSSFINYYKSGGVQEKLYLVTDKPYYSAGDTIYFSVFLVNSIYFHDTTDSGYIYVELVDAVGDIASRIRVRGSGGRFYNAIPLATRMNPGKYTLRAYSMWQTNFDKSLLFSRELEIGNYIDDAVHTKIRYEFDNQNKVVAVVEVTNSSFAPIPENEVEYSLHINNRTTNHMTYTDKDGLFRFSFKPSNNNSDCIRLYIKANGRKLNRKIQLPSFEDDFSVKFMPEGGNLIAGIEQVVAFKAVGVDGRSVKVKGVVSTKTGEEVCSIASIHDGMGKFTLKATANESYVATLSSEEGVSRTFTLPTVKPTGCVITLTPDLNNKVLLKVLTTADYPIAGLSAVVQSRGVVDYVVTDLSHPMRISLDKLRSGVAQISIIDKTSQKVVAQRLFFVRGAVAEATVTPSVKKFSPRELVNLDFAIKNSAGEPVKGDFVVSVTDAELLKKDKSIDNIFSYMLLSSDLKGNIENPTYYFEADDTLHNEHLDLVMLTHGWRRYNIDNIIAGKKLVLNNQFEAGHTISGNVMAVTGKTRDVSVIIFRNKGEYLGVYPLNSSHRFVIKGMDSPDTAIYLLQALNRSGKSSNMRIKVNPYIYPKTPIIAREVLSKKKGPSLTEEYMMRSKQSYFADGGMPIIDIEAVEIVANRTQTYDYSSSLNDFNTVSGDMSRFTSIFDVLQRFRQLEVVGNGVYVRQSGIGGGANAVDASVDSSSDGTSTSDNTSDNDEIPDTPTVVGDSELDKLERLAPTLYINGQEMDIALLDAYPMEEVISVSYLDRFEAMGSGIFANNGVIILHVKDINAREKFLIKSMAEVIVPGYATPIEFYAPDYSVNNDASKKDTRTTIAWVPSLQSNSLGDASMSFWTADRQSDYRVIIEGITSEGELLHNEFILQSK